jgi:hypothetical protein
MARVAYDVPALAGIEDPSVYELVVKIQEIMAGKLNNVGSMTLTANATTTTLIDPNIGPNSLILFDPLTSNGKVAFNSDLFFVNARGATKGQATVNHASSANTDQTFNYGIFG